MRRGLAARAHRGFDAGSRRDAGITRDPDIKLRRRHGHIDAGRHIPLVPSAAQSRAEPHRRADARRRSDRRAPAFLQSAHSETVGVGGQMRVRNRMQVFANRRESNRAWLLHAWCSRV